MSLRRQLLLISLLTLVLPWAAYQYVQEMESALRQGQEDALLASARAVAGALRGRQDLLYRHREMLDKSGPEPKQLYAMPVSDSLNVDGFADDWGAEPDDYRQFDSDEVVRARVLLGRGDRWLYVFAEVHDRNIIYETTPATASDRLLVRYLDPDGSNHSIVFTSSAPGWINGRQQTASARSRWSISADAEPEIRGEWQVTSYGYNMELRLPAEIVGNRLGYVLVDVAGPDQSTSVVQSGTVSYDASDTDDALPGFLIYRSAQLNSLLERFAGDTYRLSVADINGWKIGSAGTLAVRSNTDPRQQAGALDGLYRWIIGSDKPDAEILLDRSGRLNGPPLSAALNSQESTAWHRPLNSERALVSAFVPVLSGTQVLGAVVMEQDSEAILTLTNRALARLVNVTLLATVLAVAGLLGFATLLSVRIRRLRNATELAIDAEGKISVGLPGSRARDELGDLSRSFSTLLKRLDDYNEYLRSLASKLSHELRTPLAVVSSSLEHLADEPLPASSQVFAQRASEGSRRLQAIVSAMSAATHAEHSVRGAEIEEFDLHALVTGNLSGYRDVFDARQFVFTGHTGPCLMQGAPDLISQMLDKLIDNAVDFSPEHSTITVRLLNKDTAFLLEVENQGAALPEKMRSRLFDAMVSLREKEGEQPHLGFGLYIVKLIVDAHQGAVTADNLPDDHGVCFSVRLPHR